MSTNGVKNYTESNTLLQYQGKIELNADDPSYLSQKKRESSTIDSNPSLSETLNSMFLPREWEENGKKFIQYVSPEPATREKARDLFKALDEKIKERQAREKGICPVREELYSQCFDEIIRQVTIECPERGLLLLRVRDEIKMTIASYQTLYESAILFGIRKQLQAEAGKEELKKKKENTCCSIDDVEDARAVAYRIGMPYYVFNFSDKFHEEVMDRFVLAYRNGWTPNPCIDCNRYLKFKKLMDRMRELGRDYIVTGHYARIEYDEDKGRYLLKKAVDMNKDQSYVLYTLTQEQLAHVRFPLGNLHKEEVRQIAEQNGFINARKHDSQDICFVPDGDYASFIERYTGEKDTPGNFITKDGTFIARNKGITHYTIGQRRGLGVPADRRLYVCSIDPESRNVVLGDNSDLFHRELTADRVNMISCEKLVYRTKVKAKIRYKHKEQNAEAWQDENGKLHVRFDEPQRAITCGQAVVLYQGDTVTGGGVITSVDD